MCIVFKSTNSQKPLITTFNSNHFALPPNQSLQTIRWPNNQSCSWTVAPDDVSAASLCSNRSGAKSCQFVLFRRGMTNAALFSSAQLAQSLALLVCVLLWQLQKNGRGEHQFSTVLRTCQTVKKEILIMKKK